MHSRFHCGHMNRSWSKIGGTNFKGPVNARKKKFFLTPIGKVKKKTQNKFLRDQMHGSWFKIGGTNN